MNNLKQNFSYSASNKTGEKSTAVIESEAVNEAIFIVKLFILVKSIFQIFNSLSREPVAKYLESGLHAHVQITLE